jgi:hypothetical protein
MKFEDCELGLAREITDGNFAVDFNFHHADMNIKTITEMLPGSLDDRFNRALGVLRDVYEVEVEEPAIAHEFPATAAA